MASKVVAHLRLKSYHARVLDAAAQQVIKIAAEHNVPVSGAIPMPRRTQKFTILRSPHVDKKARDQFEIRTKKKLIAVRASEEPKLRGFFEAVGKVPQDGFGLTMKWVGKS